MFLPRPHRALLVALPLIGLGLSGCAGGNTAATADSAPRPTMAPEQSVSEACGISGDEVDRIISDAQETLGSSLDAAGADLVNGQLPNLDDFALPLGSALDAVQREVTNAEVGAALGRLSDGFAGVADIAAPDSLLAVPGYLSDLNAQLTAISSAGADLRELCGIGSDSASR